MESYEAKYDRVSDIHIYTCGCILEIIHTSKITYTFLLIYLINLMFHLISTNTCNLHFP